MSHDWLDHTHLFTTCAAVFIECFLKERVVCEYFVTKSTIVGIANDNTIDSADPVKEERERKDKGIEKWTVNEIVDYKCYRMGSEKDKICNDR